jgi:hypothetical protein
MCDEQEGGRESVGLKLILTLLLLLFVVAPDISCSVALTDTVAFTVAFGYSINMPAANTLEFVDQRPTMQVKEVKPAWNKDSDKIKTIHEAFVD